MSPAPDVPSSEHPSGVSPTDRCVTEGHCVTCSDEGIPMRVAEPAGDGLAVCVDDAGVRTDVLTGLVEGVRPGDRLLVHAGTALLRLDPAEAPA